MYYKRIQNKNYPLLTTFFGYVDVLHAALNIKNGAIDGAIQAKKFLEHFKAPN